ncbi:hypothetical protein BcepIL02_gp47 [Burkholderia phage BcepIL02]|uniref:Uncharacterized protein n=1 Tax=Burkholderia phage BcepIL02 TaxID=2886898 RepID=C5IHN9_9CAUD|nr:hypothetical protein BcepIL02_gp47 [Burkholderia phage BcepIL02]ACR15040.1 hypothetical protein BcepIL02_gp47 [Burkholderia phage BcepIL02]
MSGEHSEELLSGLTDEERAALQEDDGADDATTLGDSLRAHESANSGTKTDDDDDANKGGDDGKKADDAATGKTDDDAAAAAAAAADDAGKKGDEAPAAAKPTIVPLLVAEAPADADAKLKEIGEKKVTLVEQFDNGDITAKEYQTQLDALNKDERALERAIDKATTATEMRQQQEMNAWLGQVNDFTSKTHPEYGKSRVRWTALDTFVKEIAAKPENANLDGSEILRQAHEMVVADLGEAAPVKGANDGKKDEGKKDDKPGKPLKGAKIEPPPHLAKVPAADNQDVESGRWAALDRLQETDPIAHEEQMMKMSAADRDAYLASRP